MAVEQKIISFKTTVGEVRLMFTLVDDEWCCHLEPDFMSDLEAVLSGRVPQERVKWVDVPNLGIGNGTNLS
jgi:hypothetical protein